VPSRLRVDRYDGKSVPLIFDPVSGLANAATVEQHDLDILESILDDSAESFLYGLVNGRANRFLGGRFRTDNGKTANYQGPYYDVYETIAPVKAARSNAPRHKLYYFDSQTKLLMKTRYVISRESATAEVLTEFTDWTTTAGQAYPGHIVRKENGSVVFSFDLSSASAGPSANAGLFPNH
jgi:hypothetical protein